MTEMIERTTGTSQDARQDVRQDGSGRPRQDVPGAARPDGPGRLGTLYLHAGTPVPVPVGMSGDVPAVPTADDTQDGGRPDGRPERRPDVLAQDVPAQDADTRTSPRHLRRDVPPDPWWLTWSILLGFAFLSVTATILAADGQINAAERAEVHSWLKFLAPGVLELLAILLILLGYRRGRHAGSPLGYWLGAAGIGGYAIFLTTEDAPTIGAGLLYGGASGATILLTFAKFYEDLVKYQRDVLGRVPSKPPAFGVLWWTNRRLAWRSLMLAIEFDIEILDDAKAAGRTWNVTHDDIREHLLGPGWSTIYTAPRPTGDAKQDAKAIKRARQDARARADDLAVRAADAAVAQLRNKPFHVPALVEVATVAAQARQTPPPADVPADIPADVRADAQDVPARPVRDAQDAPAPAAVAVPTRPEARPQDVRADVPDVPADVPTVPTAPPSGLTADDIRAMIPADLVAAALKIGASWDWVEPLTRLDTVIPGWHVLPRCPTAPELRKAYGIGNDRGSVLRRMVEDLRGTLAENAAVVNAATASTDAA